METNLNKESDSLETHNISPKIKRSRFDSRQNKYYIEKAGKIDELQPHDFNHHTFKKCKYENENLMVSTNNETVFDIEDDVDTEDNCCCLNFFR